MEVHQLAANGWRLVAMPKGSKNPGEELGAGWQLKATTDPGQVADWHKRGLNFGVLLGPDSGIIDVEYDSDEGSELLAGSASTLSYKSAKSLHRIYKWDSRFEHEKAKFGYRGTEWRFGQNSAQSVIPPSVHESGAKYEWVDLLPIAELPESMWRLYLELKAESEKHTANQKPVNVAPRDRTGDSLIDLARAEAEKQSWESLLSSKGWTFVRNRGDAQDWWRPGKTKGSISGTVNFGGTGTLRVFSTSCKPLAEDSSYDKFAFMCALDFGDDPIEAAKAILPQETQDELKRKWMEEQNAKHSMVDLSQFMVDIKTKPEKRPQLDDAALAPPGLLGDMVSFIRQTARYDLPEVTLASCLAFAGMVLGRRVRAIDDTRPNLFCLSIAESGTGKNHPRQTIKRIMHAAGIDIPREGAASAPAVARLLSRAPSVVIQIDEAGLAFRAMKNIRSPQAELGGLLSELFTSSNGFFSYRAYADSKNETPVDQPHLSINAITTEQQLYVGGFTHEDIEQGLFGRFLLFRPHNMDPLERFDVEVKEVPSGIVEKVKSWWEFTPWDRVANANLLPDHPAPMVVPFSEAAKARYRSYATAISEKMACEDTFRKALWRRSKEKTSRLALVHACMKDGYREGIVIDRDSMDWAIAISNYSTRGMVYDMDHSMVESSYQANVKYFISKVPPDGIDKWQLSRKLRKFRPKERDEIFSDLLASGAIQLEEVSTGTKPRSIVKLA